MTFAKGEERGCPKSRETGYLATLVRPIRSLFYQFLNNAKTQTKIAWEEQFSIHVHKIHLTNLYIPSGQVVIQIPIIFSILNQDQGNNKIGHPGGGVWQIETNMKQGRTELFADVIYGWRLTYFGLFFFLSQFSPSLTIVLSCTYLASMPQDKVGLSQTLPLFLQ